MSHTYMESTMLRKIREFKNSSEKNFNVRRKMHLLMTCINKNTAVVEMKQSYEGVLAYESGKKTT